MREGGGREGGEREEGKREEGGREKERREGRRCWEDGGAGRREEGGGGRREVEGGRRWREEGEGRWREEGGGRCWKEGGGSCASCSFFFFFCALTSALGFKHSPTRPPTPQLDQFGGIHRRDRTAPLRHASLDDTRVAHTLEARTRWRHDAR